MTTTVFPGFPGTVIRPPHYDRNPTRIQVNATSGGAVAPHSFVNRATYTVPTGRKALVFSFEWAINRATVATVISQNNVILWDNTNNLVVGYMLDFGNAIGDRASGDASPQAVFKAADVVAIGDQNLDTAGTTWLTGGAGVTEFDA